MIRLLSFVFVIFISFQASSSTLLILGDSLSAGYQMPLKKAWPTLLPNDLSNQGKDVTVINASISGDTTGNGLQRLPALLEKHKPNTVLIELGANDGLRGFSPNIISANLTQIINHVTTSGAQPLLMQIHVLPNYGKRYTEAFSDVFPKVSTATDTPLVPFFLEGVITRPEWMMPDGLHPKADAQPWISEFVTSHITEYL